MPRALVYGLAIAGAATARALLRRGYEVVVIDDRVTDDRVALADELGVDLVDAPDDPELDRLVRSCELVSPSPGVPETHRIVDAARGADVALLSEIELAYRWEQERPGGPRPMLAITGTDGKTTTTLLVVEMLRAAGLRSVDAGNTATPLVDAIELDLDAFVVEATSFRLAWTPTFRADGAAWLNLAPDHLNWHRSMETYEAAKAHIFANQRPGDVAIGHADDPTVMAHVERSAGRHVSFGLTGADYFLDGTTLTGPAGAIVERTRMGRSLPHDVTNTLAASALVLETGLAGVDAIGRAVANFEGPAHRLEEIGRWDGVTWFNDSKATTPHAAAAAIRSFDRIVLIAGGQDKHVDLAPMSEEAERVSTVLAIGETGPEIARLFERSATVEIVERLDRAVERAREIAGDGDVVLLSPGCASFDQYSGFEHRGDEFRELVHAVNTRGATT